MRFTPAAACRRSRASSCGALLALVASLTLASTSTARAAAPVVVLPTPGDHVATRHAQIVIRGVPTTAFGALTVTGSRSGVHGGRIEADSDGNGGSFIPTRPFLAGERVTVRTGLDVVGGTDGSWSFTVETPARRVRIRNLTGTARVKHDVWTFRTLPSLRPASVDVTALHAGRAPGDLFLAPQLGPVQNGPEILNSVGRLVYFKPVPRGDYATNVDVQTDRGAPVLTWWQGRVTTSGVGRGVDEIVDEHYRPVSTVRAGNGLAADLHEFLIDGDTAWLTAYRPVIWNASHVRRGSAREIVYDAVAQEVDLRTGLVLFQWDSLDHVPVDASYSPVATRPGVPWDYFHINSIQPLADGTVLISARNTSAVYDVSEQTGHVLWTLGGRQSTFALGPGARFWFQHDARMQANGQLTLFDDAGAPFREPQSRGLTLDLDTANDTASVAAQFTHTPKLRAPAEGSSQLLSNGNTLIGWGQAHDLATEYTPTGRPLLDARFVGANASYRVFVAPWTGSPLGRPAVATHLHDRQVSVSASWNGTTITHRWRILGGPSPRRLTEIGSFLKRRFETTMQTRRRPRYVAVEAVSASGKVLGRSRVARVAGRF